MDVAEPTTPNPNSETQNSPPQSLADKLGASYVGVRNDLEISRHVFFGQISYVVRDPISFEGHNFSPVDYEILVSLSDKRSLSETLDDLIARELVSDDQTEAFFQFVIDLQVRGLLSLPITDGEALYQRFEQKKRRESANPLMKILFLKIPLGCPDNFLRSTYHYVKPLFSRSFFIVWLIALLMAIGVVVARWEAFTSDLASILAIQNLPAILLVMAALKLWHELGHGYACRHYGVSVPNAGLLFMIGTPLAFVDATGSWSLPKRSQRQVINLAGIYFEMMIAIVAAFVWVSSSNASIQSLAHFTLLVSSVTTIGFNFNPLMKYDGYFVLADLLGIPNLRGRAAVATSALSKRLFLGIHRPNEQSRWLRTILVSYGVCAAIYKWFLVIAISTMLAMQFWIIGVLVGGYYFLSSIGTMIWQTVKYLLWSEELVNKRPLAITYLSLLTVGLPALLWFCPVPGNSHARGVIESHSINVVHVENSGFLKTSCLRPGQTVAAGQTLGQLENINRVAEVNRKRTKLRNLKMKFRSLQLVDRIKANQTRQEIRRLQFELELQPDANAIEQVKSPVSGQVLACSHTNGSGNFIAAGDELLRIGTDGWIIRAVANAQSLASVKPEVGQIVHCRFHSDPSKVFTATIQSVSLAGSRVVRHEALTHLAGGFIPVDPETLEATEPFFELAVELTDEPPAFFRNGSICEIRFERQYNPLGKLLYRSLLSFANQISIQ